MKLRIFLPFFLFVISTITHYGQVKKFLQIDVSGGVSQPILNFAESNMFADRGLSYSGGFDYFFNRVGFGFTAGYFTNSTQNLFSNYISNRYLENFKLQDVDNWKSKYLLAGPTFKIGNKKFEFDIYAKGGIGQIRVPELTFSKMFFNQSYQIYHFSGTSDDYQFAWSGGTRLTFKLNNLLGLQLKADYFTTSYISKFNYEYSYRNALDGNKNGVLEDTEYFESQKISHTGKSDINVVNLHLGLILQLGKPAPTKVTNMVSQDILETVADKKEEEIVIQADPVVKEDLKQNEKNNETDPVLINVPEPEKEAIEPTKSKEVASETGTKIDDIPVINAHEAISEPIEIPATSYEAPEAKYDAEAAEFLYKAGESYFATNDFENALPCFNKLKADPNYPRAKYMFALSLCAMGNCAEAKKEYKDFVKNYKDNDSRTLEIIFASHFERCATSGKLKNLKSSTEAPSSVGTTKVENSTVKPKEYKIQFIAMKKPNATFPKLAEVGGISTEFYPNRSVYRYTLTGYNDLKSAASDVYKVRKMGFKDAFVAVYENGNRVNTLYHAK